MRCYLVTRKILTAWTPSSSFQEHHAFGLRARRRQRAARSGQRLQAGPARRAMLYSWPRTFGQRRISAMEWYNEPPGWEVTGERITIQVGAKTDFWRTTHYGFIRDT